MHNSVIFTDLFVQNNFFLCADARGDDLKYKFKLVYATKRNTVPYKLQDHKVDFNDLTFVHEASFPI